jgi:hypothetical protein
MRRAIIACVTLLFCGVITARSLPARAGKPDPLVFVFLHLDPEEGVALLRPMIAPDIGVQLDSGARTLKQGAVLRCQAIVREHQAIVEGQVAKVTDLLLDCGDQKFVVKGLDFSQRTK